MEARELRIGNWVKQGRANVQVTGAMIQEINQELLDVNPIPLTEEWLLKFGFVYQGGEGYLLEDGGIRIYGSLRNDWMIYNPRHIENSKVVRYVHQLQNLCFALTGEELTIKQS